MNGDKIDKCELELLDKQRVMIALKGEKRCRKIRVGEVPYSPNDVQIHCKLYHLWNLVVRKLSGKKISTRLERRQAKACNIPFPIQM